MQISIFMTYFRSPWALDLTRASSGSNLSAELREHRYSPQRGLIASSRSLKYICGSLRKIKSGRCFVVKCFRFRTFLEKPSIFHVKEENVEEDGIGEAVD